MGNCEFVKNVDITNNALKAEGAEKSYQFNIKDLIRLKKEGGELSENMINFWVKGVTDNSIPDYQISALLMAIYFNKMTVKERSFLTRAMAKSGKSMDYSDIPSFKVDKHSTGGLGDKTSLILSPLVACLGLKNPMVAGRGLGHTGGTIDKLETIPGFNTGMSFENMKEAIKKVGCFICGQTEELAPADKILYSIRDTSQTVDEISLITASILSKKLAEDLGGLTMDIKCGSGAFMTTFQKAKELAESIANTANQAGVKCNAIITRMDYPLGVQVGNLNEVYECVDAMTPNSDYCLRLQEKFFFDKDAMGFVKLNSLDSPKDILIYITLVLAVNMAMLGGAEPQKAFDEIKQQWLQGKVFLKFKEMVSAQSGDLDKFMELAEDLKEKLADQNSPNVFYFKAPFKGKIKQLDGQKLGYMMVALGAGRKERTQKIIGDTSLEWFAYPNKIFQKDEVVLKIYHKDSSIFANLQIEEQLKQIIEFTEDASFFDEQPIIIDIVK